MKAALLITHPARAAKALRRPVTTCGRVRAWEHIGSVGEKWVGTESRRYEEEGGELDSHEDTSPEEFKSREVVLGYRERVGFLLLQLFPNGGATDIVFVTLFCIAVGTANCMVRWSLRNAGRTLP